MALPALYDRQRANAASVPVLFHLYLSGGRMRRVKVCELSGADLDYWVAKAQGDREVRIVRGHCEARFHPDFDFLAYNPSGAWAYGGPIIDSEGIAVVKFFAPKDGPVLPGFEWAALALDDGIRVDGPTPLVVAMRLFVISKFGSEVSV